MTDKVKRIRRSWAKAAADPVVMTQLFYSRLFQIAPETETLFHNDMAAQGAKLAETLGFVVDNIDDPDTLLPAARDLAIRHVAYGVTANHYTHVGAALLDTFQQAMGDDFSQEDHDAWAEAYTGLAKYMVDQAYYTKG
ncbi:MAG: globin domain-containing protein [Planktomarina sp.]